MNYSGIVLIDKSAGIPTTKEEIKLKKVFDIDKIGHAGTLDPFATGLIICGIDKGTKVLPFLEEKSKTYLATMKLGQKTDTGDNVGTVIEEKQYLKHSDEEIQKVLDSFKGDTMQLPPMYSALKKDGVPLYKLARRNIDIPREKRQIHISKISLIKNDNDLITFEVSVSKGTYIRVLGEDIASKLGEISHLVELRRTKIGQFSVDQAHLIKDVIPSRDIITIKELFKDVKNHVLSVDEEVRVRNGADIKLEGLQDQLVLLLDSSDNALALYTKADGSYYKVLKEFI